MIKASIVKEVVVRAAEKVGLLADILAPIAELRLNLNAINTVGLGNEARISLIAEDASKVVDVLKKAGFAPWAGEAVAVEVANKVGAVAEVASKLASAEIDIRALYATACTEANTTLYLWTADNANAVKCLTA